MTDPWADIKSVNYDISLCCAVDEHDLCAWNEGRGIGCECPHHAATSPNARQENDRG